MNFTPTFVIHSSKYNPKKVRSNYTLGTKIADGGIHAVFRKEKRCLLGFAEVMEAYDKKDNDKVYACKIMVLPRPNVELSEEEMTR